MLKTIFLGFVGLITGFLLSVLLFAPQIHAEDKVTEKYEYTYALVNPIPSVEPIEIQHTEYEIAREIEIDPIDEIYQQMQQELEEIESIEDTEEWFLAYRRITFKYYPWFGIPESVFDAFTDEEIHLLLSTVETECHGADFDSKCNVASVIFNRIENESYGDTVEEVITSPNQFAYWRNEIDDSTILSIMYAYEVGDTTEGCLAFRSDSKPTRWYKLEYVFTDDAGHNFYR